MGPQIFRPRLRFLQFRMHVACIADLKTLIKLLAAPTRRTETRLAIGYCALLMDPTQLLAACSSKNTVKSQYKSSESSYESSNYVGSMRGAQYPITSLVSVRLDGSEQWTKQNEN